MIASTLPVFAVGDQGALGQNGKFGINEDIEPLNVNAAYKYKKYKKYKKVKVKKLYKHWYKRGGKWRYTWKYRYVYTYRYRSVKAAYVYKKVRSSRSSSVGAKNVVVTSKYVMATGRNSCAIKSDYNYHTRVFYNYNPRTKTWGNLRFEQGAYYGYNKGTSPEGLWYDIKTDMDFCLVHGKSHDNRGVYLIPYNGVINGKKVVNGYFV